MAGETTHVEGAVEAAVEHGSTGMPQLDFSTFPNQIFWLAVSLVVIYLILSKVALPRISGILANRAGTIGGHIQAADALRNKAVEAQAAYDKALADARGEAARIVATARAEIAADLAEATATSNAEIAARAANSETAIAEIRSQAADSVAEVARDTAQALVAALGGKADAKDVTTAVSVRMKG